MLPTALMVLAPRKDDLLLLLRSVDGVGAGDGEVAVIGTEGARRNGDVAGLTDEGTDAGEGPSRSGGKM